MREIVSIRIENIRVDHSPIGPTTYALAKHLESGGIVPPIHVQAQGGSWKLLEGRHRVLAYKLLGRLDIHAHVGQGTRPPLGHALHE